MILPFVPWSRRTIAGFFAVGCLLCGPTSGQAQDNALAARIRTAEAQSQRLSRQIDSIAAETGETKVAELFGESDEEKAARLANEQREQAQTSSIATLNQRLGDLEETLRRLTGEVEELNHRVGDFNDRLSRVRKELDYKICALAAQQLGANANPGDENALPCGGSAQQGATPPQNVAGPPATGGGGVRLAPPPGILGTLPRNETSQQAQASPNQMASLDTRQQFEAALTMLAKAQYDEARAAFRGFADMYPRDELAPQAVYWVGDIAFVQKDYPTAARAFAEELKKYPDSPRAPDSMLKLGQSLLAMNQKKEGCRALGTLANQYPTATKSIADQALTTRKTAGCR
jgi:tol-pal system protein YbgF